MTTTTLYRVLFTEVTINGNVTVSTKWHKNDYECDKFLSKLDAKLEKKEIVKNCDSLKKAMCEKFN